MSVYSQWVAKTACRASLNTSVAKIVTKCPLSTCSCIALSDTQSVSVVGIWMIWSRDAIDQLSQVWTFFYTKFSWVIAEVVSRLWAESHTRIVEITAILSSHTVFRISLAMSVVPVGKSTVFAVWDTNSTIILRIMYHLIPFVAIGSTASIVVWVAECSRIA